MLPMIRRWRSSVGRSQEVKVFETVDRELMTDLLSANIMPRTKTLKIGGVLETAGRLIGADLTTGEEIRKACIADPFGVRLLVEQTKGVGTATSSYFLMLLGVSGVKADTMISRFVTDVLGIGDTSRTDVENLVGECALQSFKVEKTVLDYAIWSYQSNL